MSWVTRAQNVLSNAVPEKSTSQNFLLKIGSMRSLGQLIWPSFPNELTGRRISYILRSCFFLFLTWPFILSLSPSTYYFCPFHGNMKCSSIMALKLSGTSEGMEHLRPHLITPLGKTHQWAQLSPLNTAIYFRFETVEFAILEARLHDTCQSE